VGDVRTSQETALWVSTACYGDDFTILYLGAVRTSQETLMDLTFVYVANVRTSQETHL
jgi:hypothetical protein